MSWVIMRYIDDVPRGIKNDDFRYWVHGGGPNSHVPGDYYADSRWVSMLYESTRYVKKEDAENALFVVVVLNPELLGGNAWVREFDEEWFNPPRYALAT